MLRKLTIEDSVPLLRLSFCVTSFLEGSLFGGYVSGKLRVQRAKSMKFKDGYMISSGQPVNEYIDSAVSHVLLRQGVLGIKVNIVLDWDPKGKYGPTKPLTDLVTIHSPKEEEEYTSPSQQATDIEVAAASEGESF